MTDEANPIDIELKVDGNRLVVDPTEDLKQYKDISFRYYEGYCV